MIHNTKTKRKPNYICTNIFGIHVRTLCKANKDAQYILDPYAIASYCTLI